MKAKTWDFSQVKSLFKDPTFIPFLMIWITHGIGGWGISFVLPTVIYELGISGTANSQLMTMVSPPEQIWNLISLLLQAFISQKPIENIANPPSFPQSIAAIYAGLHHPLRPRLLHPHETPESLGGRHRRRGPPDHLLHPAHHGQAQDRQIHLRHDRDGGVSELLRPHVAR